MFKNNTIFHLLLIILLAFISFGVVYYVYQNYDKKVGPLRSEIASAIYYYDITSTCGGLLVDNFPLGWWDQQHYKINQTDSDIENFNTETGGILVDEFAVSLSGPQYFTFNQIDPDIEIYKGDDAYIKTGGISVKEMKAGFKKFNVSSECGKIVDGEGVVL